MMAKYEVYEQKDLDVFARLAVLAKKNDTIDNSLYEKHDVKRGLRDINGVGVVCGLTEISEIVASKTDENGEKLSTPGELLYRGIDIYDLAAGFEAEGRMGFEETSFLLLTGVLPTPAELAEFNKLLSDLRRLPGSFVRDVIMKATSSDLMNLISRAVLTLYSYDSAPENTSLENVLRQSIQLIARFPLLAIYGYQAFTHYHNSGSLIIHRPAPELSTAETLLYLLRPNNEFTKLEAQILDLCLVLHAEHGGGNNSTFTTHVVTSSGTDTYSSVTASMCSLKGPRHGGANIKVSRMFEDMKREVKDYSDGEVSDYLSRLLDKQAFDKAGLIYGMGHAIYSVSDPRAEILRGYVKKLALEKNLEREYMLYEKVERLAPQIIGDKRKMYKGVSANIDFYSGLLYSMLGIPEALFTPMFAVARISGWSAHRLEEIANNGKIIRPGYTAVAPRTSYIPFSKR